MNILTYYHGSNTANSVLDAIVGGGLIRDGFHMTPDINIARAYGSKVVAIEFEGDLKKASIRRIEKENNHNPVTGHGVEVVLTSAAAKSEFYAKLWDAKLVH